MKLVAGFNGYKIVANFVRHYIKSMSRKISIAFLLIIFALAGVSSNAKTYFQLTGTIREAKAKEINLWIYKNHLATNPDLIIGALSNGDYKFKAAIDQPVFAILEYNNSKLKFFFEPGDSINMSFTDDVQHSGTSITGHGSENNFFLNNFESKFQKDLTDSLWTSRMMNGSIDAYENELFKSRKSMDDFVGQNIVLHQVAPAFKEYLRNLISYRYWSMLLAYPVIRANADPKILAVEPLPEIMLQNIGEVTLNNQQALLTDSYKSFLYFYVVYYTSAANGYKKFNDYSTSADKKVAFAKAHLTGQPFDIWLAQLCIDEKEHVSPYMLRTMVNTLKTTDKANNYYPYVSSVCAARMQMKDEKVKTAPVVQNRNAAPAGKDDLGMKDLNGKSFSLDDLKGKVVYIDFWASWCGPCRQMMPFSKQLHDNLDENQKKKITFLYISIDANEEAWKKGINDLGIEGLNVISPGNWSSKVCSYFQINSIPRYMIMDKKGNIVDFNAKRPADPALLGELLKLLE